MAPLRSLHSLRRYVGSGEDWRQAVWNRWLVSYLTPKSEGPTEEKADDKGADAPRSTAEAERSTVEAERSGAEEEPNGARRQTSARAADTPRESAVPDSEPRVRERTLPLDGAVEQRQLAARARLDALSQQLFAVEEGLDALGQRLRVGEITERRATQRMMELIERVVETAERQSEALERSLATLERVERRLARLDRWVRPTGVESVPPPEAGSGVVGLGSPSVRVQVGEEPLSQRIPSMSGSLSDLSVATLLSMFELEKRTGWLSIESERGRVRFDLLQGSVVGARIGDRSEDPLDVLRTAIGWRLGTFSFSPVAVVASDFPARSVGALLLEASHQNDEAVRSVG